MPQDDPPDIAVSSSEEFRAALAAVVEAAVESGVDVRGAWEFETRGSTHEWDVEIVELARYSDDEDDNGR